MFSKYTVYIKNISYFEYQSIRYMVFFISHLKYLVANFPPNSKP